MVQEPTREAIVKRLRTLMEAHPYQEGSTEGYYGVSDAFDELCNEVGTDKEFVGRLLANNTLIVFAQDMEFSHRDGDGPNDAVIRGIFTLLVNAIIDCDPWLNEREEIRQAAFERAQARAAL